MPTSYGAAHRDVLGCVEYRTSKYLNNVERSHRAERGRLSDTGHRPDCPNHAHTSSTIE
jgi:transposase-like protein